jgi:hypothetical protein
VQIEFANKEEPDRTFYISFRRIDQLNPELIVERLNRVSQSNSDFLRSDLITVSCKIAEIPAASGFKHLKPGTRVPDYIKQKHGIIILRDSGNNLCMPLALTISMELVLNPENVKSISCKRFAISKWLDLEQKARELCLNCSIGLPVQAALTLEDLAKFQLYFLNQFNVGEIPCKFRVVVYNNLNADVLWEGMAASSNAKNLNLLLIDEHF